LLPKDIKDISSIDISKIFVALRGKPARRLFNFPLECKSDAAYDKPNRSLLHNMPKAFLGDFSTETNFFLNLPKQDRKRKKII
jgi:hypothetical protein